MKTLAVVIGNDNYYQNAKLDNAVNDANGIAEVFNRLGYDILHRVNCSISDYTVLLDEFETRIADYDATIFYFAGHGFQLDGENYLTSIDCQVASPNKYHCSKTCITLTEVLQILNKNSDKINIVIIDACRKSFERGGNSAFTPIHAPKGTLIAFSTSPNEGAKDNGIDAHSIYTGALLRYIGREWISVEELFKKVRKTVYNLTEGKQTTWEHTSLIGDFFFNTGQLVYSLTIPYDESVVKDGDFENLDSFSSLIFEMKSSNWDRQNPAIDKALKIKVQDLDKNQKFILGRNLLQAGGYAFSATNFFNDDLLRTLKKYSIEGENHVLNGILFEIYFDSRGEFRRSNFKTTYFDKIMELRKNPLYQKSFDFLRQILEPYRETMYWVPSVVDTVIDVDVLATEETVKDYLETDVTYQVISRVNTLSRDITEEISKYGISGSGILDLKNALSNLLTAPKELIHVNNNIELNKITFPKIATSAEFEY